jgi:hypothetical protein
MHLTLRIVRVWLNLPVPRFFLENLVMGLMFVRRVFGRHLAIAYWYFLL